MRSGYDRSCKRDMWGPASVSSCRAYLRGLLFSVLANGGPRNSNWSLVLIYIRESGVVDKVRCACGSRKLFLVGWREGVTEAAMEQISRSPRDARSARQVVGGSAARFGNVVRLTGWGYLVWKGVRKRADLCCATHHCLVCQNVPVLEGIHGLDDFRRAI